MNHFQNLRRAPRHALTRLCLAAGALTTVCAGAQAADHTYQMSFTLPCSAASGCGALELSGTFVTDGTMGTLSAANLVGWDLEVGNSNAGLEPVHITQANGFFAMGGGTTLTADANSLTFALGATGDSFSFTSELAGWNVGGKLPFQILNYNSGNEAYVADGGYTLPTKFTATTFGTVAAVPEPTTYAMMLAGLAAVGGIAARRRQGAKAQVRDTVGS